MVQEELEANKNGLPEFKFDDITTFKAIVMNADPKTDGAENVGGVSEETVRENNTEALQEPYKNLTEKLSKNQKNIMAYILDNP